MLDLYLSPDGLRAITLLSFAVGQTVMAYWPQLRRWPDSVPSRSAQQSSPIVPIEWAFAIWGVIFFGCGIFALFQIQPDQLSDPLLRRIGWLAAAAFALNMLWEYYVPKYDIGWPSFAIIAAAAGVLLTLLFRLETEEPLSGSDVWLVAAPLQLLAGWISAATFVNLGSALKLSGVRVDRRLSLLLLFGAAGLGSWVALASGAVIYATAVAWAFFGIVVANRVRDHDAMIATVAGLLIPVVLGAALIGG